MQMGGCLQFLLLSWPEETKQGGERLRGSCLPGPCPPKPSSSRRGGRLQRRRWRAVVEEVKMGTTRSARWGEGGSWAKMALPAPPCPAPTTAQRCLAWAPLESNLQSDTHTQRGRVWGRAPKRAKKHPSQEELGQNSRNEHNVKPAKFLPTNPGAGPGKGEDSNKKPLLFQTVTPTCIATI